MEIVVGLNLGSIKPEVWDVSSPYHLPELKAVMVTYADFHQSPTRRRRVMEKGLHTGLGIPKEVKIYLDNGAFKFSRNEVTVPHDEYKEFVEQAKPNWYAIPQDYIPMPDMSDSKQIMCLQKTMFSNQKYSYDGYVPILHISRVLDRYLVRFEKSEKLQEKTHYAIGGLIPNLLRARKAMAFEDVLDKVSRVREAFKGGKLHLFGVGGTSTLHVAALLGVDSVDSVGWRVRAARGLVQLPGIGDRSVSDLGKWKVRPPSESEWKKLKKCKCPACKQNGLDGLKAELTLGFCNRATHNLWTLFEENRLIQKHLKEGSYKEWYRKHLHNSTYRPLIDLLVERLPSTNSSEEESV